MDTYEQIAAKAFGDASAAHRRLAKDCVFAELYGGKGDLPTGVSAAAFHHFFGGRKMKARNFVIQADFSALDMLTFLIKR
jgi:hypothetical protein